MLKSVTLLFIFCQISAIGKERCGRRRFREEHAGGDILVQMFFFQLGDRGRIFLLASVGRVCVAAAPAPCSCSAMSARFCESWCIRGRCVAGNVVRRACRTNDTHSCLVSSRSHERTHTHLHTHLARTECGRSNCCCFFLGGAGIFLCGVIVACVRAGGEVF